MSIELSRDASRLIEDIELELASIRAAMALRPLDAAPLPAPRSLSKSEPAVRSVGPFDLTRVGAHESPVAGAITEPPLTPSATQGDGQARRKTLQERLASLRED